MLMTKICNSTLGTLCSYWKAEVRYGSAKRKYGVGGMDEVWNRKYERGPIRIASILSIYARMASQGCTGLQSWCPTSNFSRRQFPVGDLVFWKGPGKIRFNLARGAQSAPNSKMNSPYDPTHGAPELPEASGSCPCPANPAMHGVKVTGSPPLDANLHLNPQPSTSSGGTS